MNWDDQCTCAMYLLNKALDDDTKEFDLGRVIDKGAKHGISAQAFTMAFTFIGGQISIVREKKKK
jgi:hypothetical protein